MEIHDVRAGRVAQLIKHRFAGNSSRFAAAIGRSPNQVARWFMSTSGQRNIGEKLARDIEKRLRIPVGWLDNQGDQSEDAIPEIPPPADPSERAQLKELTALTNLFVEFGPHLTDEQLAIIHDDVWHTLKKMMLLIAENSRWDRKAGRMLDHLIDIEARGFSGEPEKDPPKDPSSRN